TRSRVPGRDTEAHVGERGHRRRVAAREGTADAGEMDLTIGAQNVSRLLRGSLEPRRHPSLRGHYPTGSEGREAAASYLSRADTPAPLLSRGIHRSRAKFAW